MPKVSVIIPSFNLARFIVEAIQSVRDQSLADLEIVVVDDGSTDNTRATVEAVSDARIRYVYQTNRGLAAARNTGLAHARGDYLAFLDADDLFLPGKLALQVQELDRQAEIGLVAGGYVLVDEDGAPLAERRHWQYTPVLDVATWLHGCPFIVNAVLVRREWVERVGGFDPALRRVEDRDLWLRLAYRGCPMAWTPSIVCAYRMRRGQMVRDGRSQKETTLAVLEKFFAQPDLPANLREMREPAFTSVYFEGACREYAAGEIEAAQESLAKAMAGLSALYPGRNQLLVDPLISWAIDPLSGDPTAYLERVLSNLPAAADFLSEMKEKLLRTAAVRGAIDAHRVGNAQRAEAILSNAARRVPALFTAPKPLMELVVDAVRDQEPDRQVACVEAFYNHLPAELAVFRTGRREALGRLFMAWGFDAQDAGQRQKAAQAVRRGVQYDPTWLRDRGVWSIMLQELRARLSNRSE